VSLESVELYTRITTEARTVVLQLQYCTLFDCIALQALNLHYIGTQRLLSGILHGVPSVLKLEGSCSAIELPKSVSWCVFSLRHLNTTWTPASVQPKLTNWWPAPSIVGTVNC